MDCVRTQAVPAIKVLNGGNPSCLSQLRRVDTTNAEWSVQAREVDARPIDRSPL